MSAVPLDRKEQALGKFLCTSDGADAFRDACGNDLVYLIGQLAICGDKAAIGSLVLDYLLADKGMQNSMQFASAENTKQLQRELFGDQFPSWDRFRDYDRETGGWLRQEIARIEKRLTVLHSMKIFSTQEGWSMAVLKRQSFKEISVLDEHRKELKRLLP